MDNKIIVIPQGTGGGGGGSVNSVSGTSNRTTSSGGTDPVIDIASNYVGQASITTLGTIATGVWNGTPITNAFISSLAFSKLTGLPTTLSGYGIIDAYTQTQADAKFFDKTVAQTANTVYRAGDAGGVPSFSPLSVLDLPSSVRPASYIGNIVSIPTWTGQSGNFTKVGSAATFTYGTSLSVSNATPITTTLTDYITYDPLITSYEDWIMSGTITVGTVDANSRGVYFGLTSQVTGFNYDFGAGFIFDATDGGAIELYYNKSTVGKVTSANKITVASGGTYTYSFQRKISQFIATITDASGNSNVLSYDLTLAYPSANTRINPNAGKFTIGSLGGSFTLGGLTVNSNMPVGADRCLIGDSIIDGVFIEDPSQRMAAQVQNMTNEKVVVYAQPGNLIQSANTVELLALNCTYYHIAIGTNNFTQGESASTIAGRITTLVNALTTGGVPSANIFIHSLLPRNTSVVAVNAQLKTTFGTQYRDFYTSFVGTGTALNTTYTDDALHLNYLGQNVYAKQFYSLFKLKTKSNAQFESYSMRNPLKFSIGAKDYTPFSPLDVIDSGWQIRVGNSTSDKGGYIGSVADGNISFGGGTKYNGTNFIAKHTSANIYNANNNLIEFYIDAGLPIGGIYTPTRRAQITDTQFNVYNIPTFTQNASSGAQMNITNSNTGNSAYMYVPITAGTSNGGITQYPTTYTSNTYLSGKTAFFSLVGTGVLVQGAIVHLNAGTGTTNNLYRTTNGGSDVAANIMLGASGSITAGFDWALNQTDGFVITQGNVTRRIAGVFIKPRSLSSTAGSEGMELDIYTQVSGAVPVIRASFGAYGLQLPTIGEGIQIKEGTNARMGTATLVSGTVTIANTSITANTRIFLTATETGTITNPLRVTARVNGTSFTVGTASPTDTVILVWELKEGI